MIKPFILSAILLFTGVAWGQEFKVEYDKNRDFTLYKTFRFGEGELVTPKDQQQVSAAQVDKWIKENVSLELQRKGLKQVDSAADLVVSYMVGTLAKSDAGDVGPMGLTPGSMERTYMKDYRQANIVIDLNDRRDIKIWRINASMEMVDTSGEKMIAQVVEKGFRKYPKSDSVKKKKK